MRVINPTEQALKQEGYGYDVRTKKTTQLKPIGKDNGVFTIEEYDVIRNPTPPIPDVEPISDLQQHLKANEGKIEEFAYKILRIAYGEDRKKNILYELMCKSSRIVSLVNNNNIKNHTLKNQEEVLKRKGEELEKREENLIRKEQIHEEKRKKIKVVLRTCIDNI